MKKYRSNILKTEFKRPENIREKWAEYMRERRKKIKLGLIKTKTKSQHYQRNYQRTARERVIKNYGGKCVCCGENKIEFLAIDHIEGGGRKHRAEIKSTNIAIWIIKNNFPKG